MFTNKEVNTLKAMFYAASRASSPNPDIYRREFDEALNDYFICFPNDEIIEDDYFDGDIPSDK